MFWQDTGLPTFMDPRGGFHFEGGWKYPKLEEDPVEGLLEENRRRGVDPDGWSLGARWKGEEDIPDEVYFPAMEAIGEAEP